MKNPLLTDDILYKPCPRGQKCSSMHETADGKIELRAFRCGGPQCPVCGLRNGRIMVQRFGERVAADQANEISADRFFVTIGFAPHPDPLPGPKALELLDRISRVIIQTRQPQLKVGWLGADLEYIKIIHLSGPSPHAHLILSHYTNKPGIVAVREALRKRIENYWNRHLLRMRQNRKIPWHQVPYTGEIYLQPCRNLISSLAYELWEEGEPWKGDWRFPKWKSRVRPSRDFVPELETDWKTTGDYVLVRGDIDTLATKFAETDAPIERISPTRLVVEATRARCERILTPVDRRTELFADERLPNQPAQIDHTEEDLQRNRFLELGMPLDDGLD